MTYSGRTIAIWFRGDPREIEYVEDRSSPAGVAWWFADHPEGFSVTATEWSAIDTLCRGDLDSERARWRRRLAERLVRWNGVPLSHGDAA